MPVIARFYGIVIKMYFREHGVPHFHAIYGEYNGVLEIETLEMIEGDLPPSRCENGQRMGFKISAGSAGDVEEPGIQATAGSGVGQER